MTTSESAKREASPNAPDVIVQGDAQSFLQKVMVGSHQLQVDEPVSVGGTGSAPDPYDYLLAGLGACTSMTVGLYARRKKWPLQHITVSLHHSRIHAKDCEDCETKEGMLHQIDVRIELTGPLTSEQHATLMEVAGKCPVHRTLKSEIKIRLTETKPASS
jgi:putative redox protein